MFLDWIINTFFVKKFEKTDKGIEKAFNYLVEKLEKNGINKFLNKDGTPFTIYMAGAPGAGKTEFVESSLEVWDYIVIDIDKYRKMFKGHNGRNSKKYQKYAKKVADKMHKYCIKNKLNFVLDGTFGNIIGE